MFSVLLAGLVSSGPQINGVQVDRLESDRLAVTFRFTGGLQGSRVALDDKEDGLQLFWANASLGDLSIPSPPESVRWTIRETLIEATPGVHVEVYTRLKVAGFVEMKESLLRLHLVRNRGRWAFAQPKNGPEELSFGVRPQPPRGVDTPSMAPIASIPTIRSPLPSLAVPPPRAETRVAASPASSMLSVSSLGPLKVHSVSTDNDMALVASTTVLPRPRAPTPSMPLMEPETSPDWTKDLPSQRSLAPFEVKLSRRLQEPLQNIPRRDVSESPSSPRTALAEFQPPASTRKPVAAFEPDLSQKQNAEARSVEASDQSQDSLTGDSSAKGVLTYIGFQHLGGTSRVFMRLDGKPAFRVVKKNSGKVVLVQLSNCSINVENNTRPLDTSFFPGPVTYVRARELKGNVIVEVKLRNKYTMKIKRVGRTLAADFQDE